MLRQPNVTVDSGLTMDQLKNLKSTTHQSLFTTGILAPNGQNQKVISIQHGSSRGHGPAASVAFAQSLGNGYGGQKHLIPLAAVNKSTSLNSMTTMAQLKMSLDSQNRVNLCNESQFSGQSLAFNMNQINRDKNVKIPSKINQLSAIPKMGFSNIYESRIAGQSTPLGRFTQMGGYMSQKNFSGRTSSVVMQAHPDGMDDVKAHADAHPEFQNSELAQKILSQKLDDRERDACGVGFIANLNGEKSHEILKKGISALVCNEHRGGCNYDGEGNWRCGEGITGDGAGIMTQVPWKLLQDWAKSENKDEFDTQKSVVGTFFLQQDEEGYQNSISDLTKLIAESDFKLIGFRKLPVEPKVLGQMARDNSPTIFQAIMEAKDIPEDMINVKSYVLRKTLQKQLDEKYGILNTHIVQISGQTMVYKGMVMSEVLNEFYLDLKNELYETQFCVYHRRFSTNTLPRWSLAQPMRFLAHNGEINTYQGNINSAISRQDDFSSPKLEGLMEQVKPVLDTTGSDSYALDNLLELYIESGFSPLKAMMMIMPEAYKNQPAITDKQEIVDFYEYHAALQEPWDGPANVTFCDGNYIGATLDRNGLRPARYEITNDGMVYFGSEVGSQIIPQETVVKKGRLGPGQMFALDLKQNKILTNWDIKSEIANEMPYGEWLKDHRVTVSGEENFQETTIMDLTDVIARQTAFGISDEDAKEIIWPMAAGAVEATFSMGEDTPLAFLTTKPRVLYDYFKQRFAQVTNPPIDFVREGVVMSLDVHLGAKGNILQAKPEYANLIKLDSPVLNEEGFRKIKESTQFNVGELSLVHSTEQTMKDKLMEVLDQAVEQVKNGSQILIVSDRGVDKDNLYVPSLLATGAIHHRLIQENLRSKCSIVVDTAQCWSTHHYACLVGYGASAICPYLALETVRQEHTRLSATKKELALDITQAQLNYKKAIEKGLLKILSKMGISLLSSYQGAQIFEILGLADDVVDVAFRGSTSRVGGLNMDDVSREIQVFHTNAYNETLQRLKTSGFLKDKKGGEYHFNSKAMVKNLHKAIFDKEYDHYKLYEEELSQRPLTALRDLMAFNSDREPISVDEVESVEEICKRFATGGMSLGALSREAHETLAVAMNRIGGISNSGEGGEDFERFLAIDDVQADGKSLRFPHLNGLKDGDSASSAIKQVASGRFGVTAEYLNNARQIEIKIAQGAKPGEGGQLPGAKVSEYIAGMRYSKPGVTLISPPPHHDIYSIEDLSQLIFDLHEVNPEAKVSVKLVAEVGIGTVASGVAKANADVIQISGHEGGTGASPISSMKHAGGLWELGLTEAHQALQDNGIRGRVLLRVDGGIRAGWEVVMAAILGADEYGFGSIAMIAEGCVMARVCHLNTCPVGVATQREDLRAKFKGTPENVVDFFFFLAQEVREVMAHLGYRSINELIGQTQLLKQKDNLNIEKSSSVDLSAVLKPEDVYTNLDWLDQREDRAHYNGYVLDDDLLFDDEFQKAVEEPQVYTQTMTITNQDRAVGTRIAGTLARKHGDKGFKEQGGTLNLSYRGTAGQSFGAYLIHGMNLTLFGQSNDYVAKSMCGGRIVIRPDKDFTGSAADNVIIGNTCLYGANGGQCFASGTAGERLAVRNSGAEVVVEGSGDHCCEYMTGGRVVVLGQVGRNVGAGMTGGLAYILDESDNFLEKMSGDVRVQKIETHAATEELISLITQHANLTDSETAKNVLENMEEYLSKFWQVIPPSEDNTNFTHRDIELEQVSASNSVYMDQLNLAAKDIVLNAQSKFRGAVVVMSAQKGPQSQYQIQRQQLASGVRQDYWSSCFKK